MKHKLPLILALLLNMSVFAQTPSWVNSRPVSETEYIGIGMCPVSDPDYMKKATQNALADISSQIALKVDNKSFLHLIDVDGKSREMLEDKITNSVTAWIEGQELKDACTSDNMYYVYYTLNKNTYKSNADRKRQSVISSSWDYLAKGKDAENNMQLLQAAQLYGKGLEAVEPWVFMDLTYTSEDGEVNIPVELYNGFITILGNLAITTNLQQLEGEPFKPISKPIAGCLSKNGTVIPNVKLKAEFVSGSGAISKPIETDYNGTSEFYVTNITSKLPVQEIRISIDDSFFDTVPASYKGLLKKQSLPTAKVTIALQKTPATCYLRVKGDNDLQGIEQRINSLMTNNYFTITEDIDYAEYVVELSTKLETGEIVTGGAYNMNSCYCTLILKIYNNANDNLLLNYSVNQVKVLAPVHKTANETLAMCTREVMKRVNRELPELLKNLNKE